MTFKEYADTEQFQNECETAFQHAKGKRYRSSNTARATSPAPRAHGPSAKPLEDRQRSVGRIAFEEPEEAHADHFKSQDITAEMVVALGRASMMLGQVLRKGHNVLVIPERDRKKIVFKDGSLKQQAVLEGWFHEKNNNRWNRVSCFANMFSEGSVERSGQSSVDDRKALFGAIHTNMGSRYCIVLFCGQEFTPVTDRVHCRVDKPGRTRS
jgi:hypothetical protein